MFGSLKVKVFAGPVLRAMAREQTGSGSERIVPRHKGVAGRLGLEPDSPALEAADPDAGGDSYRITEAGWEDLGV